MVHFAIAQLNIFKYMLNSELIRLFFHEQLRMIFFLKNQLTDVLNIRHIKNYFLFTMHIFSFALHLATYKWWYESCA